MKKSTLKRCNVPLSTRKPDELLRVHRHLAGVLRDVPRRPKGEEVVFHFEDGCTEIDVGAILLLIYAGFELEKSNWLAKARGSSNAMQTLTRNLTSLWNPQNRGSIPHKMGEFLLRGINAEDEVVATLEEWANLLKKETKASEEQADLWQFQISEVVTNSLQHGLKNRGSDELPLLVAGQYRDTEKQVQLAVLDFGDTIPKTIEEASVRRRFADHDGYSDWVGCDGDLIRFAAQKGITSKSVKENQGAGLPSLVDTVQRNGGRLQILSRNGLFHVDARRGYRRNLPVQDGEVAYLNGTLTTILLNLRTKRRS